MRLRRIILAFLVAPLMTPVVFIVVDSVRGLSHMPERILGYFLLYGPFAYLATAIFGIPAYFLFRALRWNNALLFVLGGAVIGLIVSFLLLNWHPAAGFFWFWFAEKLWCTLAGALSALVFRMILFDLKFAESKRVPVRSEK